MRLTWARGETRGGSAVWVADSKPMVGEMDSRAAGLAELGAGDGVEEAAVPSGLTGDLAEVDQPWCGVKVKRKPRADDMS